VGRRKVVRVEGGRVKEEKGKRDRIGALRLQRGAMFVTYIGCRERGLLEREILLV
jgi:hypothetical protein